MSEQLHCDDEASVSTDDDRAGSFEDPTPTRDACINKELATSVSTVDVGASCLEDPSLTQDAVNKLTTHTDRDDDDALGMRKNMRAKRKRNVRMRLINNENDGNEQNMD